MKWLAVWCWVLVCLPAPVPGVPGGVGRGPVAPRSSTEEHDDDDDGGPFLPQHFQPVTPVPPAYDPCYDEDRPRRCLPDFVNAAFGVPIVASSTCGQRGPVRLCNDAGRHCLQCDAGSARKRYPPAALTDVNNSANVTCWRSEPLRSPTSINDPPDNVTLTLSLGKKFELTYVTLTFCPGTPKPDSIAIYKSADYGRSWQPFQFYSSQCRRVYGRPNRATITRANEQEARCTDAHRHATSVGDVGGTAGAAGAAGAGASAITGGGAGRIAFSTLDGRPSAVDFDSSPVLQDWVTATDVRVVFHRHRMPPADDSPEEPWYMLHGSPQVPPSYRNRSPRHSGPDDDDDDDDDDEGTEQDVKLDDDDDDAAEWSSVTDQQEQEQQQQSTTERTTSSTTLAKPTTTMTTTTAVTSRTSAKVRLGGLAYHRQPAGQIQHQHQHHYAVSDFAVGGRCKCNGHASHCLAVGRGADTELACDCKHNTAGRDCERCKPFHFDRPWGRATVRDANECKVCNCNGHARRCRFNMELYKMSGRISGGVCLSCRHATTGRHCHYCREGYYRDATKPVSHRKVCKACDCHPIGSSGKTCNHTTGQCSCKDGVTGLTCNRCARGYQQSRSHIAPCIKVPRVISLVHPQNTAPGNQHGNHHQPRHQVVTASSSSSGVPDVPTYRMDSGRECGKCRIGTRRLNLNKFCKRDYAIMVKVVGRDTKTAAEHSGKQTRASGGTGSSSGHYQQPYHHHHRAHQRPAVEESNAGVVRFILSVQKVFKRSRNPGNLLARVNSSGNKWSTVPFVVSAHELGCRCPKLKLNRSYLILGRDSEGPTPGTLGVGPRTIIIEWRDEWQRRLRKFQRQALRTCDRTA
ncbi:netrin-A-like [Anopheles aquasalis]|uniref:netrin-A-like n=1 Tax=Anopheles aquasalis TaxID=42839 RepID=UPI00215A451D|nr:netrin-A-like [Anopheles aquasalis]